MARTGKRAMAPSRNKTETVSVRLSPKYRYALDLLARMSQQSVGAAVEGLIRDRFGEALKSPSFEPLADANADQLARALKAADKTGVSATFALTWDPRESDRFINIATNAPGLLTEDEELIWRLIKEAPAYWKSGEIQREILRAHWEAIVRAARKGTPSLRHLTSKE